MALLDGGLKAEIGLDKDILALMLDGTLHSKTRVLSGGEYTVTNTNYAIKGFYSNRRSAVLVGGSNTIQGTPERIALILAHNLAVAPKPQDEITLQGQKNAIETVETDPANATYTLVLTRK